MKDLTRAEEEVMMILWRNRPSFVKQMLEEYPDPKPAYNTTSTIVRILQRKGFVGHESFGKSHKYNAIVTKEEYRSYALSKLKKNYFNDSTQELLEYLADNNWKLSKKKSKTTKKISTKPSKKKPVDTSEEDQLNLF